MEVKLRPMNFQTMLDFEMLNKWYMDDEIRVIQKGVRNTLAEIHVGKKAGSDILLKNSEILLNIGG